MVQSNPVVESEKATFWYFDLVDDVEEEEKDQNCSSDQIDSKVILWLKKVVKEKKSILIIHLNSLII